MGLVEVLHNFRTVTGMRKKDEGLYKVKIRVERGARGA
jgi:hypothetical protein